MSKAERSAHARNAKKTPKASKPWNSPSPLAGGDDKPEPLFTAVGKALSNWEHVENQLANLFVAFIGGKVSRDKPSPSVRAYGAIVGFQSRLAMLEAAARAYFILHPQIGDEQELWSDLSKQLAGFSTRRNDIAHGSVEFLFDLEREVRLGFFLMPGLYVSKKYPTGEEPAYRLTAEQIGAFAQQFADLQRVPIIVGHSPNV
jgi:hypothetical protein